jgi:hypothetical protein
MPILLVKNAFRGSRKVGGLSYDVMVASHQPSQWRVLVPTLSRTRSLYSVRLRTLGNANQQASMTAYIPIATGCSTQVPTELVN